jgi:hypothetical protein
MKLLYSFRGSLKLFPSALFIVFLTASCVKENVDLRHISNTVDWRPKYAMPLAYGSLSLKEIVNAIDTNGIMKEYPNGLLYLSYHNRIFSKTVDSIITIPNQQFQQLFTGLALPGVFPPNDSIKYNSSSNYNFNFNNGAEIDSINFKNGTLVFTVRSEFLHTGSITITTPTMTKNSVPFKITMPINKLDGSFADSIFQSLTGYKLNFNAINQIPVTYSVVLRKDGGAPILATQKISIDIDIRQTAFKSIFGYFSSFQLIDNFPSKVLIDVYQNIIATNAKVADPRLNICYNNSFGIPIRIQLNNVRTFSKSSGYTPVTLNPSVNPIDVLFPNINQLGTLMKDTVRIDKNTSSIATAFNSSPEEFLANITATTNIGGKTHNNFALDTSRFDVDMNVELPMDFQASNYRRVDTIVDFDLSTITKDYSIINKLAIYGTFTNSIPCDLGLQVYLVDSLYTKVDSLFTLADQPVIKGGEIDSNGNVIKPGSKISQFIYSGDRIKPLSKVKHALLYANISTAGGGLTYVKFYSKYLLNLSLGVQIDLKITSLDQFK